MLLSGEKDLQKTILTAPIGICILNAETFVAELLNDKFLEVAGIPREAILGHWFWEPFAEYRHLYEDVLSNVVRTGHPFQADDVSIRIMRNGIEEEVIVSFLYVPVSGDDGKVTKVAVWVQENTQQVKARQEIHRLNEELWRSNETLAASNVRLQESETHFKRLVEQAPVAILVFKGADMVIDQANRAMLELLGKDAAIIGMPLLEGLPEIKGAPAVEQLFQVYRTGEAIDGQEEAVPILTNGEVRTRYFNFSYRPLLADGQVIGVMDVAVEVTTQVLAREQADQQKRVYETITSGTPDLMYVWDLEYKFTYVNKALLTMWGKTWDTAVGKGLRENGYEEWHAAMHEREIDQVVATKKPVRGEVAFPHAVLGKRIYDYILIPVIGENGEVEAVAGTTRDVTDRKHMEQELTKTSDELQAINEELAATNEELASANEELTSANEELSATNNELATVNQALADAQVLIEEKQTALKLAIEAANFGTWFIHSVTREFITDARLKELFGYYPDEDLSIEQALAQITDEYRGFVSDKLEKAIYQGGDYDVTYPVVGLHDNRLRWLRAIGNLKADPSGSFSAFTGVVMDVTEQHANEQRKNDFIGMVSHELKTPLTSLSGMIQVSASKLKNSDDRFLAGVMESASKQVKRMGNMINGFLNISRLESAKLLIDKTTFDLCELITEVAGETQLVTSSHTIHTHNCEHITVHADHDKIASVLTNLLSNAVKYSPKGTVVQIACRVMEGEVQVSVKDEGPGLNAADKEKVFDRYFRVESAASRHISGFGIGLYLSSEIIKRHNGQIWVESEPGKGATFYFTLPL
ncbi:PAS domain-containing protein [Mucilaginibacter defluvii]|uniref:histidine kinase n=1 Tax=Mucilaginibacter defluvii TaxID=1196019 RepID=A0ABP9G2E8_9SPHI